MKFIKNKKVYIIENIKKDCIIILNNGKELSDFIDKYSDYIYPGNIKNCESLKKIILRHIYEKIYFRFNNGKFDGWGDLNLLDKWSDNSLKRIDYSLC